MLKGAETLASLVYTRDSDGQVKKTTSKGLPGAEVTENTYDENSRLTKAGTTAYEYDAANNADETRHRHLQHTTKPTSSKTAPALTYTYNELGQRTKTKPSSGPATTYGYDQAGNLTSVERPKEGEVTKIEDTYAYDGNGLRASQTISGTTSYLTWDMAEALPADPQRRNEQLHLRSKRRAGRANLKRRHSHLPTPRPARIDTPTDGSQAPSRAALTYDAYGNPTGTTGPQTTPLGYDGAIHQQRHAD